MMEERLANMTSHHARYNVARFLHVAYVTVTYTVLAKLLVTRYPNERVYENDRVRACARVCVCACVRVCMRACVYMYITQTK